MVTASRGKEGIEEEGVRGGKSRCRRSRDVDVDMEKWRWKGSRSSHGGEEGSTVNSPVACHLHNKTRQKEKKERFNAPPFKNPN